MGIICFAFKVIVICNNCKGFKQWLIDEGHVDEDEGMKHTLIDLMSRKTISCIHLQCRLYAHTISSKIESVYVSNNG